MNSILSNPMDFHPNPSTTENTKRDYFDPKQLYCSSLQNSIFDREMSTDKHKSPTTFSKLKCRALLKRIVDISNTKS